MTIYSAGLRISEAVYLKIKDIDSQRIQTLRHSFTTEIYTHITTKGFDQIVSLLDKLEIMILKLLFIQFLFLLLR